MRKFEVVEHTADIGLRAHGKTLKELFCNAAEGMFSIICDLEKVAARRCLDVKAEAEDKETLLVEWLNELLYLFEVEKILFNKFDVIELEEQSLKARACGEEIDLNRHEVKTQIKACTYHMLKIAKNKHWRGEVIFDV